MTRRLLLTSLVVHVTFLVVCSSKSPLFQETHINTATVPTSAVTLNKTWNVGRPTTSYTKSHRNVVVKSGNMCPKHCTCSRKKHEMKCSRKIRYIPKPPSYVTSVIMRNASLLELTEKTFRNITRRNLSHLELYKSGISHVAADAFSGLQFSPGALLSLSGNPMNFTELGAAFCALSNSSLNGLQLDDLSLKSVPAGLFDCLRGSQITTLSLQMNNFSSFSGLSVSALENLQILNLTHNQITSLRDVEGFRNLTRMELHWNKFTSVPCLFNGTLSDSNLVPKIQTLRLGSNSILKIVKEDFKGLRNLVYLELKFNFIKLLPDNLLTEMPSLRRIYLKHNNLREISTLAFNSSSLRYVDISSNGFHFSTLVTKAIFKFCPNLDFLFLTANTLDISDNDVAELFSPLKNLTRLIMENMGISVDFPSTLFKSLPSLEELIASSNTITTWGPDVFEYAKNLKKLYLDNNKIISISESSFPKDLLANLEKLNLANNPFACTCDLLWFRNWLKTTNVTVVGINSTQYKCQTPKAWRGKKLLSFNRTAESCVVHKPNLLLILGSSLGSAALVGVTATIVLIRYRMHIRYCCFLASSKLKGYREISGGDQSFTYDAFVVYSSMDRGWVFNQLSPRVEHEEGFKLCLCDRDFIPGSDIVDNIMVNMEESRKVILVLSDNFAASEWCKWEMSMAQHKLLDERREILILVKLNDIQPCNMSNRLMLLMRDKIYIDWADCQLGQDLFWKKLLRALARQPETNGIL